MVCDVVIVLVRCLGLECRFGSVVCFFFQAEDGIRDLVRSRGLGDVYKRQVKRLFQRQEAYHPRFPITDDSAYIVF